jgi:predicted nucleic acid-binding protein
MTETLMDSNVLVAFFNEDDSLHEKALKVTLAAPRPLIVHEYVVQETATILMLRAGKVLADAFILTVLGNADFSILHSTAPTFLLTIKNFIGSKTKQLSFTDSALLALSKQYSVLTFDDALNRAIKKKAQE